MQKEIRQFIKGYDFMRLGQAVSRRQWQAAAMTVQRMERTAKTLELSAFARPLQGLKQAVSRKNAAEAKQLLALVTAKRVQLLRQLQAEEAHTAPARQNCRMHLITGGSGSGKSAYAEEQVLAAGEGRRVYIATMIPYGEEGSQRVERHRRMRSEKQFETMECYTGLEKLSLPADSIVLLECVSNLTANEIFDPAGAGPEHAAESVCRGIAHLRSQAKELYIVTNEVFSDGVTYDEETARYLSLLGEINQRLAQEADLVTEVVCGIPVSIKK